jgi:hypothetical protein
VPLYETKRNWLSIRDLCSKIPGRGWCLFPISVDTYAEARVDLIVNLCRLGMLLDCCALRSSMGKRLDQGFSSLCALLAMGGENWSHWPWTECNALCGLPYVVVPRRLAVGCGLGMINVA